MQGPGLLAGVGLRPVGPRQLLLLREAGAPEGLALAQHVGQGLLGLVDGGAFETPNWETETRQIILLKI